MLGFALAFLLVQYLEQTARTPRWPGAALLYDVGTGRVAAWATDTRVSVGDVGTAAVNVMRGAAPPFGQYVLLTTQQPTVMCLGMAALLGVRRVVTCAGRNCLGYAPGNDMTQHVAFADPGPAPNYPHTIAAWLGRCHALLPDFDEFATEFANVPATDGWPARVQDVIFSARVDPDLWTPPPVPPVDGPSALPGPEVDAYWMGVARRLVGLVHLGANLARGAATGHNIGCVLVDGQNRLLAWGVNTLNNHPSRHAETKCIWMFQRHFPGHLVPAGATLYTTLQSCLMCSGTIKHACGTNLVRVVYADADKVRNSALTFGAGAREVKLSEVLERHPQLMQGQHLLAAARWDRLRRAFHQRVHHNLLQVRRAPGGMHPAHEFLHVMMGRTREDVERTLAALNRAPLPGPVMTAVNQLGDLKRRQLLAGGGAGGAAASAGAGAGSAGGPASAPDGRAIGAALGGIRERAADRFKAPLRASLTRERGAQLALEGAATALRFSGGAPVLLQNPVMVQRFYEAAEIRRRERIAASLDDAIALTRQRIRDLTTQINALDLMLDVVRMLREYNRH